MISAVAQGLMRRGLPWPIESEKLFFHEARTFKVAHGTQNIGWSGKKGKT